MTCPLNEVRPYHLSLNALEVEHNFYFRQNVAFLESVDDYPLSNCGLICRRRHMLELSKCFEPGNTRSLRNKRLKHQTSTPKINMWFHHDRVLFDVFEMRSVLRSSSLHKRHSLELWNLTYQVWTLYHQKLPVHRGTRSLCSPHNMSGNEDPAITCPNSTNAPLLRSHYVNFWCACVHMRQQTEFFPVMTYVLTICVGFSAPDPCQ